MIRERIIDAIDFERLRQDEQWGGPEHDDKHEFMDWFVFIDKQFTRGIDAQDICFDSEESKRAYIKDKLVKIAALAVAALESMDRQEVAQEKSLCDECPVGGDETLCRLSTKRRTDGHIISKCMLYDDLKKGD